MQFEPYEIEKLRDLIVNLNKLLTNDAIFDLKSSCQDLINMIQELNIRYKAEEKFNAVKDAISQVQNDTAVLLNNIKKDVLSGN